MLWHVSNILVLGWPVRVGKTSLWREPIFALNRRSNKTWGMTTVRGLPFLGRKPYWSLRMTRSVRRLGSISVHSKYITSCLRNALFQNVVNSKLWAGLQDLKNFSNSSGSYISGGMSSLSSRSSFTSAFLIGPSPALSFSIVLMNLFMRRSFQLAVSGLFPFFISHSLY